MTIKKKNVLPQTADFFKNDKPDKKPSKKPSEAKFSYFQLYRYSTAGERFFIFIGLLVSCIGAAGFPYSVVIYGEYTSLLVDRSVGVGSSSPTFILNLFGGGQKLTNATREENDQAIRDDSLAFGIASISGALMQLLLMGTGVNIMNYLASKQISRIRKLFLEAILRQDMSWYDTKENSNFASTMTEDLDKIKEGIGEKVSIFIFLIMTFIIAVTASFFYGWELTLVVISCCPFIIIATAWVAKVQSTLTEKELASYGGAGAIAEEVLSGIRTVLAFSGESKEIERYSERLLPAENMGKRKGLYSGLGSGFMWLLIYVCYAIAMWYGVKLIIDDRHLEDKSYTPAVLVIVLFGIIMGAQNLGFSSPHMETFATAKGAAQSIFGIIDRKSPIDSLDAKGNKPKEVIGNISFENIRFRYPARSEVDILKGFSLSIKAGQTVALVGASGCGKSTSLQLMQRFYDPLEGSVKLDGQDLKSLNVGWLRSQIGVVGQEPVLFATSIGENIRYGHTEATQEDIEKAARMANCHQFIMKFPNGYDTPVGERGAQMSGGQKQRIAIARALVRNPRILLLDEATSALDPTSERRVQNALEIASRGRTTLVVSHRLSTITNADKIVFVKDGVVVEEGTHRELMSLEDGHYRQLVKLTQRKEQTEKAIKGDDANEVQFKHRAIENDDVSLAEEGEQQEIDEKEGNKANKEEKYKVSFREVMRLNSPEWRYIVVGTIAACTMGASFPVWAILFGDFFGILGAEDDQYVQDEAIKLSIMFVGIGLLSGLATFLHMYMFNTAGVKMTTRLRRNAFSSIISQEVAYFDSTENSVGALCARLAGDCAGVQGATGARIGIMAQAIATLSVGIVISFIYSWNLTLVTLVTLPFLLSALYFEAQFMETSAVAEKAAVEKASQVAVEAISNIRTVASLGHELNVMQRYSEQIDLVDVACRKKTRFRGFVFGFGQTSPFIAYGISLYYGGTLVAKGEMPYENIIKVSEALLFGSWMLGQALAYTPNVGMALMSAGRLLKLFNRIPAQQNPPNSAANANKSQGDITYEDVYFEYPTRPGNPILEKFSLSIKNGTTIALVGPSGSGKSTCVQLLLRYYDPVSGKVNLSGTATTEFSFDDLRSQLGLVSQEPVLFDKTIAENIAYGNNFRQDIPMAEIIEAAKKSNIHDFIVNLPNGYDTSLGANGAQLSGGQKQRIAIARAMVRNPKILILDEATSALDMESEKVVQMALDAARSGRTCVTIAHRLTTVQDADMIYVLKKGVVVESGTHQQLMALNGIYANLYVMQQVS